MKSLFSFLSTLSLRRATRHPGQPVRGLPRISIHALLAESDQPDLPPAVQLHNFYPRSPCGERPAIGRRGRAARGNFYPRSPCGERPPLADGAEPHAAISIHALLAESDDDPALTLHRAHQFLSTLSLRRATSVSSTACTSGAYFYPRSPCGERRYKQNCLQCNFNFYPRSPCGERPNAPA